MSHPHSSTWSQGDSTFNGSVDYGGVIWAGGDVHVTHNHYTTIVGSEVAAVLAEAALLTEQVWNPSSGRDLTACIARAVQKAGGTPELAGRAVRSVLDRLNLADTAELARWESGLPRGSNPAGAIDDTVRYLNAGPQAITPDEVLTRPAEPDRVAQLERRLEELEQRTDARVTAIVAAVDQQAAGMADVAAAIKGLSAALGLAVGTVTPAEAAQALTEAENPARPRSLLDGVSPS